MALSIRNDETEKLAREVARLADETLTEAITRALEERLAKLNRQNLSPAFIHELKAIADRCAKLPDLDARSADDILYDERGLPH